jgi:hypothetical protein
VRSVELTRPESDHGVSEVDEMMANLPATHIILGSKYRVAIAIAISIQTTATPSESSETLLRIATVDESFLACCTGQRSCQSDTLHSESSNSNSRCSHVGKCSVPFFHKRWLEFHMR